MNVIVAGPTLDNAVGRALKMGINWPVCDDCESTYFAAVDLCSDCGTQLRDAEPPYSTDIKAAWLIVDEMAKRRMPVSLYSMSHGVYFCFFGSTPTATVPGYTGPSHEARADTPAEAICRAALLYLERI